MDASALLRSGPVDQSEPRLPVDPLEGFSGCGIQAGPHAQQKTKVEALWSSVDPSLGGSAASGGRQELFPLF